MIHGMRNVFRLALAGLMVGVLGLSGCGGGGGSSSTGGTLPQTSIAPTATLDGWTPNDSTLLQYKTYTFAASATDPNIGGSITEFRWDFGDGTTRTTPVVLSGGKATTTATYSYVASGTPTLSVVAKNAAGLLSTAATKSLTVGTSPSPLTVSFTSPTAATLINAVLGNSVTLTYKVNVVYTGFGTVSASGVTLDPGEATATKATPVDAGGGNYTIAVTYAAATAMGSRTVTPSVKVVDSNGVSSTTVLGPAITIKTVSATNTAPIISLTAASTPAAGTNATWQNVDVVFTAIASDPDEDPLSYTWDLGDGTVITGTTELTQTHKYSRPGLYSVKVTANDGRTGGTKTADLTLNVLVNRAPTVVVTKALPTGNPTKYQRVTLNAAVTDLDSDLPTVTWNFGDGTPPETGTPVVHQFKAAGVSTIVATVDDGKGGSGSSTLLLTVVENNPPVAAVTTASAELFQNKVYTFTATASDIDTADTIASYEWDFGNGVVVAGGASQTHVFPVTVTGAVAVRARAIDSRGAVGDWSPAVNFTVVATKLPIVTFTIGDKVSFNATSADQVIAEFLVSVTNPNGAAGTFLPVSALTVVAGDAAGTVQTIINHQDGTYTIPVKYLAAGAVGARSVFPALVALDDLGIASNAVAATATVNTVAAVNVTPVATLVSAPKFAAAINATWMGVDVVFTATGSDPDGDLLVYTWDFGDGTVLSGMLGSAALIQTHKYAAAGNYSVKLTADDGRARGTKIADLTLSVLANAAPTVVVTKTSPGGDPTKYQRVTLLATVTDTDATTLTWNFGDGSAPVLGTATMVHQFQAAGLTNITATADDGKGGVTSGALQLNIVENNPPVAAMTTTAASLGNLLQNKSYTFTATASDPDGDAIASYEWDFGNDAVVAGGASQTHVFPVTVTGAVAVRARAIDSRGAVGDWSPAVSFTVVATQFPVVTVVSPASAVSLNTEVGAAVAKQRLVTFVVRVTNPNGAAGVYLPLASVAFSANDALATVVSSTNNLDGTYSYVVRYAPAAAKDDPAGRTSSASVAGVTDGVGVTGQGVSAPVVTIVTQASNQTPVATLVSAPAIKVGGSDVTTYQGVVVTFTGTATDADSDQLTYTWDFGDGTPVVTGTAASLLVQTHTFASAGTYGVKLTVDDSRTNGTKEADLTMNVLVNRAPTLSVVKTTPVGTPTKYQRVTFTATVGDLDGDVPSLSWDFGDATAIVTSTATVQVHQFLAAGISTVKVTADDGKGGVTVVTVPVTVLENNPPVTLVSGTVSPADAPLYQTKTYTFTASATDPDATDTIASYEWDFGNGAVVAGGASQTHVFPVTVTGAVAVRARAIDSRGAVGAWSPAVSFTVVATQFPVVTVVSPASAVSLNTEVGAAVAKQRLVTFVVRVTNPNGAAGVYLPLASVAFSANDALATVVSSTNNLDGTYSYVVRYAPAAAQDDPAGRTSSASVAGVTDGVGVTGQGVSAPMVTIVTQASNQTPVATLVSAPAVAAGTNATWQNVNVVFTGTATDADSDPLTYTWDFGDGTVLTNLTGASALVQTHKFTSAGNYSVKLTVDDSRTSGTKIADLTMNVLVNRAPQVVVTKTLPSGNPTKYQRVTLNAAVTDLDGDVPTLTWNFGDGSVPVIGTATMVHQFLAAGLTNVTVTADDAKGGVTVGTLQLTVVENNPPVAAVTTVTASLYQNKSYTFTATASDPDGDAIASYEWDFGNGAVVAGGASQTHVFPATVTGAVAVRARAIDGRGAVGDWSPAVSFTVVATPLPAVSFTSPLTPPVLNVDLSGTVTQAFTLSVTNPRAGASGVTDPIPVGNITFLTNDTLASVLTAVSNGGGSYTFTVQYTGEASAHTRTSTPTAYATDSLGIQGPSNSGPLVTVNTLGVNHAPTITLTTPATDGTVAYTSRPLTLGFTLTDADNDAVTYTVDWGDGTATVSGTPTGNFVTGVPVTLTHTYADAFTASTQSVSVTVTATDHRSASATATPRTRLVTVTHNALPTATITSPQNSGSAPTGLSGSITPPYVVVPLNGRLSFAGTPTKPGSQDSVVTAWTFPGGVPTTGAGDTPGDVVFAGTAGAITPLTVTYTVTDALGRSATATKLVLVDGINTQSFTLSLMYRQKSDDNGTSTVTAATTAANGLGIPVQIFQDGLSNTYAVQNQADLAGAQATVSIPVRSDLPFWITIPNWADSDARTYFMRIPNAPTGAYADTTLGGTLDATTSSFGFANVTAPWNPTLQVVTAQGFAPEVDTAARRKLQGLYSLTLPALKTTSDTFWLNRMSAPFSEGVITSLSGNAGFSGISAYQSFAEWPLVLEAKPTGATASLSSTAGSPDLAFNLNYGTYVLDGTSSASYGVTAMQAFRAPKGSTDPYDLSVAGWNSSSASTTLTSTAAGGGVGTFFSQMITASVGTTRLAGGLTGLSIPYDANDPDRGVIAASTRNLVGIRSVFSYAEYLWTKVWAWPLVLNSAQLKYDASLSGSTAFYRYSVPGTDWPSYLTPITPDGSRFDLNVTGGATFAPQTSSPVNLSGTPGTFGVGRFFWTIYTPWYNAVPGATIARTWLADPSGQPPTTQSGSATGDATAALGFVPPQDTTVDKRGRNADGSLSGAGLGGYRVTWFNATKDEGNNPVPPDFWVVELVTRDASGGVLETRHFMLPGSFPASYPTYSPSGLPNPEAIAILTDARVAMTRQSDSKQIVAPGYCWFDVPTELRPLPSGNATLTVFALKSILKNNAPAGARVLNRPEWIDAIKTAAANMVVKGSDGTFLTDIYKIPFNYYWDIVITNGPATPVAP